MKKKRTRKFKIVLGVAALFVALCVAGYMAVLSEINDYGTKYCVTLKTAPVADAVMVLGALVHDDGRPSSVLEDRLRHAHELYVSGKAPKIIVSGDHGTEEYDEVNVMRNWLLARGVPAEDIFMDHAGFNTYDSMYRARDVFGVKRLLISTQQFHMARSLYIARRLGMDAHGYAATDEYLHRRKYLKFREFFAKGKVFLDVEIMKRSPKYLGEPIPITGSGVATVD